MSGWRRHCGEPCRSLPAFQTFRSDIGAELHAVKRDLACFPIGVGDRFAEIRPAVGDAEHASSGGNNGAVA